MCKSLMNMCNIFVNRRELACKTGNEFESYYEQVEAGKNFRCANV